jgi:hypothetical protein
MRSDSGSASAPTSARLMLLMSAPISCAFSMMIFRKDGVPT